MIGNEQELLPLNFFGGLDLETRKELLTASRRWDDIEISEQARKKHQRWLEDIPWTDAKTFADRLSASGLTVESFQKLLSASSQILSESGSPPNWMKTLERCYQNGRPVKKVPLPLDLMNHKMRDFLNLASPLIENATEAVHSHLLHLEDQARPTEFEPANPEKTIHSLLPQLTGLVLNMISKTMVLELHVAKLRGQLPGETPHERFNQFVCQFENRRRSFEMFKEYPVLGQQLVNAVENWAAFTKDFLSHLFQDWPDLVEYFFNGDDPGPLVECDTSAGDGHRGGKSVILLRFESGKRLVYKPRSLATDQHFYDLLQWLNQRGNHPAFLEVPLLNKGEYGWMHFVQPKECQSEAELSRFYQRQGGYLALLYAIEAVDFHYENLIACGEHPVLIDLESLFQPRITMNTNSAELALTQRIAFSVLRVGLLPVKMYSEADKSGIDLSGLGSETGQLTPRKQPFWENAGTDDIRLSRKHLEMGAGLNRPKLDGKTVDVLDYAKCILAGFQSVYQTILENRDELISPNGPLAAFADDEIRVIFRATRVYATLQQESFHPDALRDAMDRDRLFDQLWQAVEEQPFLYKLIPQELRDLKGGDIPLFTVRASELGIRNCYGEPLGFDVDRSGLDGARDRILQMDENDLERQSWFVNASLSTLAMSAESTKMASYPFTISGTPATSEELLGAARHLGERITKLAIHQDGKVAWIGMSITPELNWVIAPLSENLYSGNAGIILFLAHLGELTGDAKYRDLAEKTFNNLCHHLREGSHELFALGAYSGWGGILYLMTELGHLWQKPELWDLAETQIPTMMSFLEEDGFFDVLYGAAGGIGSLLTLYKVRPNPFILEQAIRCGNHLLKHQTQYGGHKGWIIPATGDKPLAGFSHGSAGIAWAMFHLAEATGDQRFEQAARDAVNYERSIFCEPFGNWPDLRAMGTDKPSHHPDGLRFMNAWCHGASGIALGRLGTPAIFRDPQSDREVGIAIETTRINGFGGSHCICHGDLGNLEMMHLASIRWKDATLNREVYRRAKTIVDSFEQHGHLCGIPLGVETPGLMNGLAGIGYQLLRLAKPSRVPCIMVLESASQL